MTISEALVHFETKSPKGEFVLVIEGAANDLEPDAKLDEGIKSAAALVEDGLSVKDAVKRAAIEVGCSRNALYRAMIDN